MDITLDVIAVALEEKIISKRILRSRNRYHGLGFAGSEHIYNDRVYVIEPSQIGLIPYAFCVICTKSDPEADRILKNSGSDYLILNGEMSLGAVYEAVFSTFNFFNEYEKRLQSTLASEHVLESFLNTISSTFHAATMVTDSAFNLLAYNTNFSREQYPERVLASIELAHCAPDTVNIIGKHVDYRKYYTSSEAIFTDVPPIERYFVVNHIENGVRKYTLSIHECDTPLRQEWGTVFEDTINLLMRFFTPDDVQLNREFSLWIKQLGSGEKEVDGAVWNQTLAKLNWKLSDSYQFVFIPLTYEVSSNGISEMFVTLLKKDYPDSIVDIDDSGIIQLIHLANKSNDLWERHFAPALVSLLSAWKLTMGVSSVFFNFMLLPYHYKLAKIAAESALPSGAVSSIVYYDDVALPHMAQMLEQGVGDLESLFSPLYARLRHYDREHETDYVNTVYTYVANERHLLVAAKQLFIHRNTLVARLEKIEDIFGPTCLDSEEIRFRFVLSHHLWALQNTKNLKQRQN